MKGKFFRKNASLSLRRSLTTKPLGITESPLNFIKKLRPLISEPFVKCVNECFEKGEMSCSQKRAVITLIEKKEKDRTFIEN